MEQESPAHPKLVEKASPINLAMKVAGSAQGWSSAPKVARRLRQLPELKSALKKGRRLMPKTKWPPQQGAALGVSLKMGSLVERVPE